MNAINIAIIEDEPLFRDLLARTLSRSNDIRVLSTFESGELAITWLKAKTHTDGPADRILDVAVVDIQLRGNINGIQTAYRLRKLQPHLGVIFLSNHRVPGVLAALDSFDRRGVSYLLKTSVSDVEALHRAILATADGSVVLDKAILDQGEKPDRTALRLTERQREILDLVAQGYTNTIIADRLDLSPRTVENHLARIYQELEISDSEKYQPRVQAVVAYLTERFPIHLGHLNEQPDASPRDAS